MRSRIPKAIKSNISSKEKCFSNHNIPQEKYDLSKKSIRSIQTLKSIPLNKETAMSSISTAIYRRSSNLKTSNVEVIFVKPEKSKSHISKRCKACKSKKNLKRKIHSLPESELSPDKGKNITKTEVKETDVMETYKSNNFKDSKQYIEKTASKQQSDINHCMELLIQERNKKVKHFMAKLLIKKKKTECTKSLLPMIAETDTSEMGYIRKEEETHLKSDNGYKNDLKFEDNKLLMENNRHLIIADNEAFSIDGKSKKAKIPVDIDSSQLPLVEEVRFHSPKLKGTTNMPSKDTLVKIRLLERKTRNKFTLQQIEFASSLNQLTVSSKIDIKEISPVKTKKIVYSKHENLEQIIGPSSEFARKLNLNSMRLEGKFCVPSILLKLDSSELQKSFPNCKCRTEVGKKNRKFSSKNRTMLENNGLPNQIYSRVSNWISSNDFLVQDNGKADTDLDTVASNSKNTDLTSVSKIDQYDRVIVEERTDVVKFDEMGINTSTENFTEMMKNINKAQKKSVRTLSKFSQYTPFQNSGNLKSASAPPTQFSVIVEAEESVRLLLVSNTLLNFIHTNTLFFLFETYCYLLLHKKLRYPS